MHALISAFPFHFLRLLGVSILIGGVLLGAWQVLAGTSVFGQANDIIVSVIFILGGGLVLVLTRCISIDHHRTRRNRSRT